MTEYALTAELVFRGLCLVNFVAFVSFFVQFKGLCASGGLAPTADFMKRVKLRFTPSVFPPIPNSKPDKATKDKENAKSKEVWFGWTKAVLRNIWARSYAYPTLFWFSSSDTMHYFVFGLGMGSAVLGFFGFGFPPLNLMICMICYLSFHVVGQPWLGLQMHVTLLESDMVFSLGTMVAYLSWSCQRILSHYVGYPSVVSASYSPFVAVFLMRFLVWRIMLGCGACKYGTRDPTWRDLTAMDYHYFTQPLPNPLSYRMAALPHWVHAGAVVATHVIEGPLTFLAFGNAWCRVIAFLGFAGLNVGINFTGNYGYLGLLTVVESISVLDDDIIFAVTPRFLVPYKFLYNTGYSYSLIDLLIVPALTLPYLLTSLIPLISTFHGLIPFYPETIAYLSSKPRLGTLVPRIDSALRNTCSRMMNSELAEKTLFKVLDKCEQWNELVHPFHIINRYAKFGTMTTKRREIIVEGSDDGDTWKEFEFKYKISNPEKRPVFCPLHLPGIDWQIWFLPSRLTTGSRAGWFWKLVEAMLQGKKDVMDLLAPSPFSSPPRYIRVNIYDYTFCFDKDPKNAQRWWNRKRIASAGVFTLDDDTMVEVVPHVMQGR